MTTSSWGDAVVTRIAAEIRRHRTARGMTGQALADACEALGHPLPRTTLANLESGRRASLDVTELLVLAQALDIPAISLLFPLGHTPTVPTRPGEHQDTDTWQALALFTGETPLTTPAPPGTPRALLDAYRNHAEAVHTAEVSTHLARERRRKATTALDPARRTQLLDAAAQYEQLAFEDYRELRTARQALRTAGLPQPPLPPELAFVDLPDNDTPEDEN
jgi:transcriptional regulator with XRE-family HTH domain